MSTIDLQQRRKGIGGSDVAAILGISPWSTPLDVWRSKVIGDDIEEQDETDWQEWGHRLEPVIREKVAEETGAEVLGPCHVVGDEPWKLGNLDGRAGDAVLEIKTARFADGWGQAGTDEVPDHYLTQVAWYMHVADAPRAVVAALIAGSDFRIYHVERNRKLERTIVDRARAFWADHVCKQVPPDPVNLSDCKKRWPNAITGSSKVVTPIEDALRDLYLSKRLHKQLEKDIKERETEIGLYLEDSESIKDEGGAPLATFKTYKRKGYIVDAYEVKPTTYRQWRFTKTWKERMGE